MPDTPKPIRRPTRGLKNRNPGNLRHSPNIPWRGLIGPDSKGFCVFDSDEHGIRAMVTDADGKAVITFEPPIRTSPANNTAVEITSPTAIMRLVDDNQASWTIKPPALGDGSSQFVEAFPA